MIYLALCIIFLLISGICSGIFECVVIMDTMKHHWKRTIDVRVNGNLRILPYWSKELFELNKDRNSDGDISWLEKTFPNDGGHRIKVLEILSLGYAIMFASIQLIPSEWWFLYAEVSPFIYWWVISFGFTISFAKFRKQ